MLPILRDKYQECYGCCLKYYLPVTCIGYIGIHRHSAIVAPC